MAQVNDSGSERSANVELNLVPFIDLMSVLITFLLITAVWSQVSMIQIGSSIYGKATPNQTPPPPPPMADIPLRLDVHEAGYHLVIGSDKVDIPKVAGKFNTVALLARLKGVKQQYAEKQDAVITVDDQLEYENLITGMDTLLQAGFPGISISTVGAE